MIRAFFQKLKRAYQPEKVDIQRRGFFPIEDWSDKNNYRHQIFIQRDGTSIEAVYLSIGEKRQKEEIIAKHYCKNYARLFFEGQLNESPEFFVLGRDDPWDFEMVLGGSRAFNIEITSISSPEFFRVIGLEDNLRKRLGQNQIAKRDALKLELQFPGVFEESFISKINSNQFHKSQKFKIPESTNFPDILIAALPSLESNVEDELRAAIGKKEAKSHRGKSDTVLIIDNLTMISEPVDFFRARETLLELLSASPFEEIWLYTGYYSDVDGENAEYSLLPLKLPQPLDNMLAEKANSHPSGTDEFGRIIL